MYYVYLIESLAAPGERYVGMTTDLRQRLREHNAGKSSHTSKFKPWKLTTYVAFTHPAKAEAFERYLNLDQATHSRTSASGSTAIILPCARRLADC
jgi:putative endonuclease